MVRTCSRLAIVAWLVTGVATAGEFAQLGGTAELEARMAAIEERLAEHDAEARTEADAVSYLPDADEPAAVACDPYGRCVGRDFAWGRCRTEGYYGGAEIMLLKPFTSGFASINSLADSSSLAFLPGWRLWGGYQNCDGLGWRVNWWQWDQFSSGSFNQPNGFGQGNPAVGTADLRLVFQKLDLLATQMVSFRKWDFVLLGGVTYAGSAYNSRMTTTAVQATENLFKTRFDGWGLTAGTLVYRDIGWLEGLKGYGGVQWSGVYGNSPTFLEYTRDGVGVPYPEPGPSSMLNILELKVGTQYERRLGWGAIGFASAGFESQYWSGLLAQADLGLVGFTLGTGIRR